MEKIVTKTCPSHCLLALHLISAALGIEILAHPACDQVYQLEEYGVHKEKDARSSACAKIKTLKSNKTKDIRNEILKNGTINNEY
ncbi:hypothetical protein QE152_g5635 [Popillia japonica]|uniref:Secreted protein n=1 Tax=Popillia japonica TaxID=7064 RepID=A0AAW1MMG5_POPJA